APDPSVTHGRCTDGQGRTRFREFGPAALVDASYSDGRSALRAFVLQSTCRCGTLPGRGTGGCRSRSSLHVWSRTPWDILRTTLPLPWTASRPIPRRERPRGTSN